MTYHSKLSISVVLSDLYDEMGDRLALQYGGSGAHRKVHNNAAKRNNGDENEEEDDDEGEEEEVQHLVRSRKDSAIVGHKIPELLRSIRRHYNNSFTDGLKQDSLNLFLGLYVMMYLSDNDYSNIHLTLSNKHRYEPQCQKRPLWEMQSDYYLHNRRVMQRPSSLVAGMTTVVTSAKWWRVALQKYFVDLTVEHRSALAEQYRARRRLSSSISIKPSPPKPGHSRRRTLTVVRVESLSLIDVILKSNTGTGSDSWMSRSLPAESVLNVKKTTNSSTNRRKSRRRSSWKRKIQALLPEAELSRLLSAVSVAEDYFFTPLSVLSRQSETGPVQRFAGSEYFSFDKILQQTSFKPLPEQQTRRLRTRRAKTVVNSSILSPTKSKNDSNDADTSIVKIEDPVKTDMRMYRMHLNWNELYEKEKYIWDSELERIGLEGMEEAKRVFSSLDEHDQGVIPRRLLRNLVAGFVEKDKSENERDKEEENDDDEMIRFDEFCRLYFDLLNAKPSTSINVDFDTETRGMLAYYRTHLNAFLRDPRNTQDMREAQRETSSARTFEMGEFKGKVRERRVLSIFLKGSPVGKDKSE